MVIPSGSLLQEVCQLCETPLLLTCKYSKNKNQGIHKIVLIIWALEKLSLKDKVHEAP